MLVSVYKDTHFFRIPNYLQYVEMLDSREVDPMLRQTQHPQTLRSGMLSAMLMR